MRGYVEPASNPLVEPLSWVRASTLRERVAKAAFSNTHTETSSPAARRRLDTWRQQEPFGHERWWRQRLASAGVDEAGLLALLTSQDGSAQAALEARPEWFQELEQAFSQSELPPFSWPVLEDMPDYTAFLPLVEPLVWRARARLVSALELLLRQRGTTDDAPFEPVSASHLLMAHLPQLLAPMLGRALVVELHAAQLEGGLAGETSEARFQAFTRELRKRGVALDILGRYPVLARCVVECLARWEASALELMRRLVEDSAGLRARFHGGHFPGVLVEARGGVSDPHRGGRCVYLLRFASGAKLVYKPRSLGSEAGFQRLLSWLDARGATPPSRTVEVWDRGEYGWMEHVDASPCASVDEVRRFYLRQGASVALLHVLDGTDFHYENVIAAGEHPVLVDVETLFHPLSGTRSPRDAEHSPGAPLVSALRSGLLPQRFWGTRTGGGVDLSGLGSREGQRTAQAFLQTAQRGTDRMHYERSPVSMVRARNLPSLEGRDVPPLEHRDALAEGFSAMYRLLLAHREELLSPTGPLSVFADVPMRVLFRNTSVYATLLFESYHPHALADALERQRFFDHLWRGVVTVADLATLVPLEQEELERGDLPYFHARPSSRDVESGTGQRLVDFFAESGLARVRRRLQGLCADDHERQRWVLERSLDVPWLGSGLLERPSYSCQPTPEPATRRELRDAAHRLGRRLLTLSFQGNDEARWLSLIAGDAGWSLAQPGTDLFQGLSGIALSLGYLGDVTGDMDFTLAARRALLAQARVLEEDTRGVQGIGILNGWGGIIFALTQLGVLWGDDALLDSAAAHVARLPGLVAEDRVLDIGAGAAGCLVALLLLEEHRPSSSLREVIHACGERLVSTARPQSHGVAWLSEAAGHRYLAGMAHGAAGIALALLRFSKAVGNTRARDVALAGLDYERSLYSPQVRNWPDLREHPPELDAGEQGHFLWAWCTGAPGIGLARVAGLPILDDARVREDISRAVETTLERGFGRNHGLCHGDLGNADFLLETARVTGDFELESRTYRLAGGILRGLAEHGPLYGLQGNTETPGLMVGLAGIAYGLVRLSAPERVPSLLALASPSASHDSRMGGLGIREVVTPARIHKEQS